MIALSLQHVIKSLEWNIKTRGNARAWSLNTWTKCSQQCHSFPQQSLYAATKSLVGSKLMKGPYSKCPAPYFKATKLQMVLVQADFGHQPEFLQYALRRESWWVITRAYIDVHKAIAQLVLNFLSWGIRRCTMTEMDRSRCCWKSEKKKARNNSIQITPCLKTKI